MVEEIKYWDNAATTQVDSRIIEIMLPYFDVFFGNPSSNHVYGKQAKNGIDLARSQVSKIINCDPSEIYFTSGSTESINWALKGYLEENPNKGNHIITVRTEHKAVLNTCDYLESKGYEVTYLSVNENGLIDLEELKNAIRENTSMICVMYVNNEIGVIQDIQKIGEIARLKDITFFCDATQAIGKIPVDVVKDNIDLLCFSAHKLYGPKGVGALFIRQGIKLEPLIHGGGQEKGLRGGTYNSPLIVGFGKACELALNEFDLRKANIDQKREQVFELFSTANVTENFVNTPRVKNIISLTVNEGDADEFLMLHSKKIAASTGSACNSNIIEISHVVQAVFPKSLQSKVVRISI